MHRIRTVLVALCLMAGLLAGCGTDSGDENLLKINKEGNIISTSVEEFDTSIYSVDELKAFVADAVADYTAEHGVDTVKLDSLSVRKDKARMVMTYASYLDYNEFNGSHLFVGTIGDAKEAGYDFTGNFVKVSGKHAALCGADEFETNKELPVVIVDEITQVELNGPIAFASREHIIGISGKTARLKRNADILFPEEEQQEQMPADLPELEIIYTYAEDTESGEQEDPEEMPVSEEEEYSFEEEADNAPILVYMICR